MKKRHWAILTMWLISAVCLAQTERPFEGYLYNEEYQIYLKLNVYDKNIMVPDQDIYGELPGYLGSKRDSRLWLITDANQLNEKSVELSVINDYGSEDFIARITIDDKGVYTFKHIEGSTYKIVVNSKYVKIPKTITFVKQ
jgi:hypothetical protein